jgi:hypothetical protein
VTIRPLSASPPNTFLAIEDPYVSIGLVIVVMRSLSRQIGPLRG